MATPLELNQAFINVWDGILDINNNLKLKDAENVKLTGNQTISGIKTFSVPPVSATNPSSNNQVANKGYVDNAIALAVTGEIDPETSAFVTKEGDQEIGGIKTFNQSPIVPDLVWEDEFDNAEPPELITAASPDGAVVNRKSLEEAIAAIDITDSVGGMIADAIDEALFIDDKPIYVTAIGNDPQDVNGVKTFISSPIVPTPTTNMQAATKKYVDDKVSALDGFVTLDTDQVITGKKVIGVDDPNSYPIINNISDAPLVWNSETEEWEDDSVNWDPTKSYKNNLWTEGYCTHWQIGQSNGGYSGNFISSVRGPEIMPDDDHSKSNITIQAGDYLRYEYASSTPETPTLLSEPIRPEIILHADQVLLKGWDYTHTSGAKVVATYVPTANNSVVPKSYVDTSVSNLSTIVDGKLTAPQPEEETLGSGETNNRALISQNGILSWETLDNVAPLSLITEPYLTQRLQEIESVNFLGIVEFAGDVAPELATFASENEPSEGDVYIDYITGTFYKYELIAESSPEEFEWNSFVPTHEFTSGDFYEVNAFVNFDNVSGTLTWVHDINSTNFYWYHRLNSVASEEVLFDGSSLNKNSSGEAQIKDFTTIPNDSFITKESGVVKSISIDTIATKTYVDNLLDLSEFEQYMEENPIVL